MTPTPLFQAHHLGIMRGERILFRDVSISISPGQALILRGENGSGKTTLLKILCGFIPPDTGEVRRSSFHWVGHRTGLKLYETPRDHLQLWAKAWGAKGDIDAILSAFSLTQASDVPARYLSAGQARRTALARTQLNLRKLWLLDEPFSQLDVSGIALLTEMIKAHRAGGGGIIAAVHGAHPLSNTDEITL